ncbi:MAG TPA: hypothetical protein VM327_04255 [Candidatus Thermoplasmatota archaeon]|nr:hypothetical protein [Candidatus Thermoplasmatota archaeon]
MKRHSAVLAVLSIGVSALLLATRLPAQGTAAAAALALAALVAALGLVSAARPSLEWAPPSALAATVALLAVPASNDAVLHMPAPLVALPALGLFHWLYPLDADEAPRAGHDRASALHAITRLLPIATMFILLAILPWLASLLLPDRLSSTRELSGPLMSLATALGLAALLAAVVLGRAFVGLLRRRAIAMESRTVQAGAVEEAP